ncbi:hypothetical protein DFJ43DRAFT_1161012 [Lentinula guzmanii]|uniref:Uncharacterized protein n=1 Tax=Lentinula guzmanii TaxID=2804957 RepID=A0AA38MUW5_9AGAR|nr:hypothetical protein DFJ43DRAFT_1161012 [Lentinula guzmanii]
MSPTNSRANSPSDDEEQAELLLIQKKKEERARREAEQRKAEEEAEAAAEARLAEIPEEEAKAAEAAKQMAEEAKQNEEWHKAEEASKAAEATSMKAEMERRLNTAALVRAQIEKKKKETQVQSPVSKGSTVVAGKKRKRVTMVVVPSGDPKGGDPNPGDDNDYIESDTDDDEDPEEPPTSPPKQSRCSRCILKAFKCELVGPSSASCKGCRKAKVQCLLVPDDYPRRSKRVKVESPVASTSSQEEMLRYLILRVRKLEEANREEDEEEEESEEDWVKRMGDRKGKGRKE